MSEFRLNQERITQDLSEGIVLLDFLRIDTLPACSAPMTPEKVLLALYSKI